MILSPVGYKNDCIKNSICCAGFLFSLVFVYINFDAEMISYLVAKWLKAKVSLLLCSLLLEIRHSVLVIHCFLFVFCRFRMM